MRRKRQYRRLSGKAVLDTAEALDILRRYFREGVSARSLASEYAVSPTTLSHLVNNMNPAYSSAWRRYRKECADVGVSPYDRPEHTQVRHRLSWEGLIQICEWDAATLDGPAPFSASELAKRVGISRNTLYRVLGWHLHADAREEIESAMDDGSDPRELEPWW